MKDELDNRSRAKTNSGYYDHLWPSLGRNLHYTEIFRLSFIEGCFRKFTGGSRLRILDFGCGRGWMAPFLSAFGEVTGIDFSPVGISFAQKNYGKHGHFILADAQKRDLGLPENTFDVIVSSDVIEHVPNQMIYLDQIWRFLKAEGWCFLTAPNGNVWPQFSKDPRFIANLQPVENWLSTHQIRRMARKSGFQILRHEGRPVYDFRLGRRGFFQTERWGRIFQKLHLTSVWGRAILPTALYQGLALKKVLRKS